MHKYMILVVVAIVKRSQMRQQLCQHIAVEVYMILICVSNGTIHLAVLFSLAAIPWSCIHVLHDHLMATQSPSNSHITP